MAPARPWEGARRGLNEHPELAPIFARQCFDHAVHPPRVRWHSECSKAYCRGVGCTRWSALPRSKPKPAGSLGCNMTSTLARPVLRARSEVSRGRKGFKWRFGDEARKKRMRSRRRARRRRGAAQGGGESGRNMAFILPRSRETS